MSNPVLEDLAQESAALDELIASLDPTDFALPTPAAGWTIGHQIAHLAWADEVAILAATDLAGFQAVFADAAASPEPGRYPDISAAAGAQANPRDLLVRWRHARDTLHSVLGGVAAGTKLPWFGPPMSVASMASARLMETWAHGEDIADALRIVRPPTGRLHHVARLGVRVRNYAFTVNGDTPPDEEFRVELAAPDKTTWVWGPAGAPQRVTGSALDFCYLITQRRHLGDLDVIALGDTAQRWLEIAQAFAGPPGKGRAPVGSREATGSHSGP